MSKVSVLDELKKEQEKLAGEKLEFPLQKVLIDQTSGQFIVNAKKNEEEWEGERKEELRLVILDRYAEYFYYDPEKEKITKRSTIEKKPSECVEIVSGVPISELKEAGYDFTFIAHLIAVDLDSGDAVDWIIKGSAFKAFLDFMEEHKKYWKGRLLEKLVVKLEKRKKGAVKYYVPVFELQSLTEEEGAKVLHVLREKDVLEMFEDFVKSYNKRKTREETETEVETETETEEEGLPF